jgi:hypothetical protein
MLSIFKFILASVTLVASLSAFAIGPTTCPSERAAAEAWGSPGYLPGDMRPWIHYGKAARKEIEEDVQTRETIKRNFPNNKNTPNGIYIDCLVDERLAELNAASTKGQSNAQPQAQPATRVVNRYGALALVTGRGNLYGWAVDFPTQEAANKRVLDECNQFGTGTCTVVMEFRNACASYAIDSARASTAYGWAYGSDKGSVDVDAINRCTNRGGSASQCAVRVWGCTTR